MGKKKIKRIIVKELTILILLILSGIIVNYSIIYYLNLREKQYGSVMSFTWKSTSESLFSCIFISIGAGYAVRFLVCFIIWAVRSFGGKGKNT